MLLKVFSDRMKIYGPDGRMCLTSSSLFQCKRKLFRVSLICSSVSDGDYSVMGCDIVFIGSY